MSDDDDGKVTLFRVCSVAELRNKIYKNESVINVLQMELD